MFYNMEQANLYLDKHYNGEHEIFYISMTLHVNDGHKSHTTNYDYGTLEPVFVYRERQFAPSKICKCKESERSDFNRTERMIEQFIEIYNPEEQITKLNEKIIRSEDDIAISIQAIRNYRQNIAIFERGIKF